MRKLKKNVYDLTKAGLMTGIGSSILSEAGSTQGSHALSNISRFYPLMGTVIGGSAALRLLPKIKKRKKR